jgi:hypothetical protein
MREADDPGRARWARALGLCAVALLLSVFFWLPVLRALPNTQSGDGPPYHKTLEAARVSIVRYHEFPHWNAYECGGLPLWDNPQAPLGAPLVWPMFFLGTTATMALWYVLHSALGFVSMWLFCRRELSTTRAAAFVGSAIWAFAGFHQQHYSGGHFTFVPFLYFPLGILLWRRAEHELRAAVGLGVLVAWMIYEGGVYPLPHLGVILAVETLSRVYPVRRLVPIARAGVVVVLVGLTLGASRFLPVFEQLRAHTRAIGPENDALQWDTFKDMFLARTHARHVAGQTYVWPEYGAYLGPIVVGLALVGIVLCGLEHVWLVVLLAFSTALMFGHGKYLPWTFLKQRVFPFKEMRVPSRFRAEVTLFLATFAALGLDRARTVLARVTKRWESAEVAHGAMLAIALIGAGDVISVGSTTFQDSFTNPPEQTVTASPRLHMSSDYTAMIDQPRQNVGRLACWDEWGFGQGAPLWYGDVPQARASGGATLASVARTQNTFTIDVDAPAPARVTINSTYDRTWQTDVGKLVEVDKQLVLEVPQGHHVVHVRYLPRTFRLGVALTLSSLLGVVGFFVWDARRRRSRSGGATRGLPPRPASA